MYKKYIIKTKQILLDFTKELWYNIQAAKMQPKIHTRRLS